MKKQMEIRIWKKSPLIGQTVNQISKKYSVEIIKVARGDKATNPDGELKIVEADYVSYIGDNKSCLRVFDKSVSN